MPAGGRAHDPHGGSPRVTAAFGINLAGHLTSPQGLGVAARHTAHVLDERGTPWAGVDVPTPVPATHPVRLLASRCVSPATLAPHGVNLLHLNPPEVLELLWARPHWLDTETRVTACVPFWEFPHLPPSWLDGVACMDAVLAPSRFIEAVVRRALPELPVFHFAQAVWLFRPGGIGRANGIFAQPFTPFARRRSAHAVGCNLVVWAGQAARLRDWQLGKPCYQTGISVIRQEADIRSKAHQKRTSCVD